MSDLFPGSGVVAVAERKQGWRLAAFGQTAAQIQRRTLDPVDCLHVGEKVENAHRVSRVEDSVLDPLAQSLDSSLVPAAIAEALR